MTAMDKKRYLFDYKEFFGGTKFIKKYIIVSALLSIIPVLLFSFLYDTYSSGILYKFKKEQIFNDISQAKNRIDGFMSSMIVKAKSISDIPEVTKAIGSKNNDIFSLSTKNIIEHQIDSKDIYAIAIYNSEGKIETLFPKESINNISFDIFSLPTVPLGDFDLIGPKLPEDKYPGWFVLRRNIVSEHGQIGSLVMWVRLASLTENTAALHRPSLYQPVIEAPGLMLTTTGTKFQGKLKPIGRQTFAEGWAISVVPDGGDPIQPVISFRYFMLAAVALSSLTIILLLNRLSRNISARILPLIEGATQVSEGNLDFRVPEDGVGELQTLAQAFNRMKGNLRSVIQSTVNVERRAVLGQFAAGLAHEVRNPLATIRAGLQGLLTSSALSQEEKGVCQLSLDEIDRVNEKLADFLDYAKPREPAKERALISDLCISVEALMAPKAQEAGLTLYFDYDEEIYIWADPVHVRQILMNLVINAVDASPRGGSVVIHTTRSSKMAIISVSDTGSGISKDLITEVEKPFVTTKPNGTGLGLAICSELVRSNNGEIQIGQNAGKGTLIELSLPLYRSGIEHEKNHIAHH